ncbi:MAG: phosphatase PAP2 family protein [Gemmatimonadetes bacterium]|nr:phosphatase PAP2 family protein [Gemmatimonadota bacterium]
MDYRLFRIINGLAGHDRLLDGFMAAFAKVSPAVFAAVLLALWLTRRRRLQEAGIVAGVAALAALGTGQLIGMMFPRLRPYWVHPVDLLITATHDTSFPSDHATLSFAIGAAVACYSPRAGAGVLGLAFFLAIDRVFVGAHYPTDVLGGAVLGAAFGVALATVAGTAAVRALLDRLFAALARLPLGADARNRA